MEANKSFIVNDDSLEDIISILDWQKEAKIINYYHYQYIGNGQQRVTIYKEAL